MMSQRTIPDKVSGLKILVPLLLLMLSGVCSHYTDQWAVEIKDRETAELVARDTNCILEAPIFGNYYLLRCPHVQRRSVASHEDVHKEITSHEQVVWAEQQKVLSRKKRQSWRIPTPQSRSGSINSMNLNDPRWPQMWYLNRGNRLDMNVQEAWLAGFTGKGVSVTILDDGIERSHPDLINNYDPRASYDVNQDDDDPTPRYDLNDTNRHGTRCAGEVAASANNSECAVGIAYGAGIGGVKMLDGDVTDAVEAKSISLNNDHIDIYSASWGPDDDGKTVDGPGKLASSAFYNGIMNGRGGKGSIFVWASGNGGREYDNCNCDGYTNSVWTMSVSSATENGLIPWYSEACSSTLATTYSSGSSGEQKIVTTDLHHTCTPSHTGTSASAPLAAGIIALSLQANPDLTWRDVQHLTVRCAHIANLRATDWAVNALGRNYSHSFGYGLMDAGCMVNLAQTWKSVPEQNVCTRPANKGTLLVDGKTRNKSLQEIKDCGKVKFLEHVQVHVTLSATKRGDVQINLISPSGTKSTLIDKRIKDYSRTGFNDWPFLSVHMWEESPIGVWTLEILNDGRSVVELKDWRLVLWGTEFAPQPKDDNLTYTSGNDTLQDGSLKTDSVPINLNDTPSIEQSITSSMEHCSSQNGSEWCTACIKPYVLHNGRCVESCPVEGYFKASVSQDYVCVQCYYSCETCKGPNDYDCITCFGDANLEEESPSQKFCHNKSLVNKVFSSSRWYYILSIGFTVNFCVVVLLIVYITRWRKRHRPLIATPTVENGAGGVTGVASGVRKASILLSRTALNNTSRYAPVQLKDKLKSSSGISFHNYESSSDDEQLFRQPESEEVEGKS